jgi:hypothetical protein
MNNANLCFVAVFQTEYDFMYNRAEFQFVSHIGQFLEK